MTLLQAHRGVSSEFPENTMAAFRASVQQGYGLIELDPKHTLDDKFVILHDKTLNRTARDENGELGIWILSKKEQFERTMREYAPDIIETTGHIKPEWVK